MLLLDERRAVEAIPAMLDKDPDLASRMASNLQRMIDVVGLRSHVSKDRLAEIERSFRATGTASPREPRLDRNPPRNRSGGPGQCGRSPITIERYLTT